MDSLDLLGKLDELSVIRRKIICSLELSPSHSPLGPTQINVLMALLKTPESNMTELSGQVGLEKSSLTRSIDSLISAGFVARSTSPSDRRIINCALTAKGMAVAGKIDRLMARHCDDFFAGLAEDGKKELYDHLSQALALLSGSPCLSERAEAGRGQDAEPKALAGPRGKKSRSRG